MKRTTFFLLAALLLLTATSALAQTTTAWVGNKSSHSISIIDVETDDVLFTVKPMCCIPNTVCDPEVGNTPCILGPHDIAFSPDGHWAFVTAYDGDRLAVFDATPLPEDPPEYVGRISVGDRPQGIVVDPEGTYAYVSISGEDKVSVFDVSEGFPLWYTDVEVMDDPNGIAITPDGGKVFVANNGSGTVSVFDTTYFDVDTIPQVEGAPRRIVIGDIPGEGLRAYTCNAHGDSVSVIDADNDDHLTDIELDEDETPNSEPRGIALHPSMETLYVTEFESGDISVINTASNTLAKDFAHELANPYRIAISPDGEKAYIVNKEASPGTVSVLNMDDDSFFSAVEVESQPGGIAIREE
jgi:YVTN family beta-propeller protein